jgi:hypothetical protein
MDRTFPNFSGIYEVSFSNLEMTPILLPYTKPNDYLIEKIRFEHGVGVLVFKDNTEPRLLDVKYQKEEGLYFIKDASAIYTFKIHASLAGLDDVTEINLMSDMDSLY